MSAPAAVDTHGLSRSFGDTRAVDEIDLSIPVGGVFGLLGPDGAGKSTLIRMLVTVLAPTAGTATVFGHDVTHEQDKVTPRIGYMSQRFCMYPDLTIAENIDFFATLRGVSRVDRRTRSAHLLESMGLAEFADRRAGALSGGMKQKLMLASTLMHSPDMLFLDEPTTGVDPVSRREFWRILADLHSDGTTVLVATPYMDEAERCTHIAFMDTGRLRHRGTPQEILELVPGRLLQISGADPRTALAAVRALPGVTSAHLLGDVVRLLVDDTNSIAPGDVSVEKAVRDAVRPLGGDVRPAPMDMEAAFTALAETTAPPQRVETPS